MSGPDRWSLVAAAGLLSLVAMLDMGIVNLAIPAIGTDLQRPIGQVQWVVLAYQIPLLLLLLPAGRWLDARPIRPILLTALAVFAGTGVLAVATPASTAGFAYLLALRLIQGVSASVLFVMMPVLAARSVGPAKRGRALSVTATLGPLGAVLGPSIGGPVVDLLGWRWVLAVKLPLAIAAWAIIWARLGSEELTVRPGLAANDPIPLSRVVPTALTQLRQVLSGPVLVPLIIAVAGLATAMQATQFTVSVHLQVHGMSASRTGSVLLTFALCMAVVGLGAGRLADAIGPAPVSRGGGVLVVIGIGLLFTLPAAWDQPAVMWRLVIIGVGMGLYGGPTQAWVMGAADPRQLASVAAVMQLARSAGFALGPLLAASLLAGTDAPWASLSAAAAAAAVSAGCFFAVRRRPLMSGNAAER